MQRPDKRISEHVDFHRKSASKSACVCHCVDNRALNIGTLIHFREISCRWNASWEEKSPEETKLLLAVPIWRLTGLIWKDPNEKRRIRLGRCLELEHKSR